jgi:hypothetical protein
MNVKSNLIAVAALWLGAAALMGEAMAQQSRYSSGWRDPSTQAAPQATPGANDTVDRMLDELGKLIDEAERARAADPRFIGDLRDLARRYAWPWRRRVAFDDFADGNLSANPAWRVVSGDFPVSAQRGLFTRYVPAAAQPAPSSRQSDRGDRDVGKALLRGLLQQMGKPRREERAQPAPAPTVPSEIGLTAAIPNAFAVQLSLGSSTAGDGRLEFGVAQGGRKLGYRLAYNSGGRRSFELLRVGSRGSSVIESVRPKTGLEDGKTHTVLMTRDAAGELAVSIDGKEVMRVADRGFRDSFDAFVLVNRGGEYTVRSVAVYGG